jgi:hypothetical protein
MLLEEPCLTLSKELKRCFAHRPIAAGLSHAPDARLDVDARDISHHGILTPLALPNNRGSRAIQAGEPRNQRRTAEVYPLDNSPRGTIAVSATARRWLLVVLIVLLGLSGPVAAAACLLPLQPGTDDHFGAVFLFPLALPGVCALLGWLARWKRPTGASSHRASALLVGGFLLACLGPILMLGIPVWWTVKSASDDILIAGDLRQLGIAMHKYHENHFHLPAHAIYSKDGKPLLSWRVAILTYLEQREVYEQFRLGEPWYSENNLKLLPRMPKVFKRPMDHRGGDTMTHYQVFVGPGAIFEGQKPRTLDEITLGDGYSNTVLIADALEPVPWTKPEDLPFDPSGPIPPLNFLPYRGAKVCFGDCSTRRMRKPPDEQGVRVVRQTITWNGGENEDTSRIIN